MIQIGNDVVNSFDADRQPDHVGAGTRGHALLVGELAVSGRGRMDDQALGIADVGDVAEQLDAVDQLASTEGIFPCPESATTVVGLRKAIAAGSIKSNERVVLVSTGSGLKSIPVMATPSFPVITGAQDLHV